MQQHNLFQKAFSLHQTGHLRMAEQLYGQILDIDPNDPQTLHFLGILKHQVGKTQIAVHLIQKALTFCPEYFEAYNSLGVIFNAQGKYDEAAANFRMALALSPNFAEAHYNLGNALRDKGHLDVAVASYQKAITLKPNYVIAYYNLGNILQSQGKLDQAIANFRQALALKPDYPEAFYCMGIILQKKGNLDEAIATYRQAIILKPDYAEAFYNLGNSLRNKGEIEEAIAAYQQALNVEPKYVKALNNLGRIFEDQGKLDQAIDCYRQAISMEPNFIDALNNLGIILQEQGDLDEAVACFHKVIGLKPDFLEAYSNLLLCLNYMPRQSLTVYLHEAIRYGEHAAKKIKKPFKKWGCSVRPDRLRVGFISGDFRNHPVGYFLENLLANIDQGQFELIAYPTNLMEDELTGRIHSRFVEWKPIAGLTDEAAARMIHSDCVHVLLDLAGHTKDNRLPVFSWKPAPVQATWLGYFASTGVSEIDYLLADPVSVPESCRDQFTEKIWYLPETRLCFSPPVLDKEPVVAKLPALRNGYITFGSFQNFSKINDYVLDVWARILQELPKAVLRLQNRQLNSDLMREQLLRRLAARGIPPERVALAKSVSRTEYLEAYAHIDMILDTFPFPGGTTTCEALWMGVPTVTLAGRTMVARQGAALLTSAGLADWIADDEVEYVGIVLANAADLEKMARLRAGLREQVQASPLCDGPHFARSFEAALWEMWVTQRDNRTELFENKSK